MVVALCATVAGPDSWADIERFGNERLTWLRTFLTLAYGIPSHDTFGRVFSRLDPAQLVACIQQWLEEVGREIGKHIAIDGKTLRGSFDKAAGKNPLHLVSAWACETRLTLGQVATDAKSNEITAIPLLLELLDLKGATVTIDAMGLPEGNRQEDRRWRRRLPLGAQRQSPQAFRSRGGRVYRGARGRNPATRQAWRSS